MKTKKYKINKSPPAAEDDRSQPSKLWSHEQASHISGYRTLLVRRVCSRTVWHLRGPLRSSNLLRLKNFPPDWAKRKHLKHTHTFHSSSILTTKIESIFKYRRRTLLQHSYFTELQAEQQKRPCWRWVTFREFDRSLETSQHSLWGERWSDAPVYWQNIYPHHQIDALEWQMEPNFREFAPFVEVCSFFRKGLVRVAEKKY